jgi:hypothetical protein
MAARGRRVMAATALKNAGYQGSILGPIKHLAIFFARRLARKLWRTANPTRYRAMISEG